jgi:hypothetical protein
LGKSVDTPILTEDKYFLSGMPIFCAVSQLNLNVRLQRSKAQGCGMATISVSKPLRAQTLEAEAAALFPVSRA